ncbi:MAG TPA: hypothetical protein DET40_06855 [Lentisphaeria bacterium]|nr:MAG: hypothetical protein A2X45_07445 [Lentisphaerae bacterium GWF2_50_93]HCE43249.1 hypothetical protein [Lentisphaeria bacterium]
MQQWSYECVTAPSGNCIQAEVRNGSGPTFILIPETWGNALTRDRLIEALDPDMNLVCVALAGQDENWPPPQRPSIPQFSEDILSLTEKLRLGQFFVGGHSLGGMIAIDLMRFGPERILGVVSIEGWTNWTVKSEAFKGDTSSTLDNSQMELLQQIRHKLLDRWDPQHRAEYGMMWTKWDGWEILSASDIPVLEIWGDRGHPSPSRELMRIPDRKNIIVEWIPKASHNLLVEAPERLAQLINGFISEKSKNRFS